MKKTTILIIIILLFSQLSFAQLLYKPFAQNSITAGAERMEQYLPLLKGKTVAVFANQTSMVKDCHLVDTLVKSGIKIVKIFGPEHGFRGDADAGAHVDNAVDKKTGVPVISMYGDHKKPTAADLKGVDIMLFDIQDVGVRFYTFISSLEYYMEAAAENNKQLIVLDRPNPNGFYVDGPVLDKKFKSFIGMQPVPIVYGMTLGEYAYMIAVENWLGNIKLNFLNINVDGKNKFLTKNINKKPVTTNVLNMQIISCKNYTHSSIFSLPVNPSPNLREIQSIYCYPSTCFFEGTVLSEGRGTDKPFQIFGHPSLPKSLFSFTPKPNAGAKSSKCFNQVCYGWDISDSPEKVLKMLNKKIQLKYFIDAYKLFPGKDSFFLKNNFIAKLAGNDTFAQQIKEGKTEAEIRKSWEPALANFKKIRKKYLLYTDF